MRRFSLYVFLALLFSAWMIGCGGSSEVAVVTERPDEAEEQEEERMIPSRYMQSWTIPEGYDTVSAQRFDTGKMWTIEEPPVDYFRETYDFDPDTTWFRRAQQGALRLGGFCSASFVSGSGLVMTNHHCTRDGVSDVTRTVQGENLLDEGFVARSLDEERRIDDLYVEQLVEVDDVSNRVLGVLRDSGDDQARAQARRQRVEQLQNELTEAARQRDTLLHVEVVPHYSGAQYKAYTYRKYEDVRLVMAPELDASYFGGDADNFEYPRHSYDVSFLRVYDVDGEPLETPEFFPIQPEGSAEGDAVFVVGSPGTTKRHHTVSQVLYDRDFLVPQQYRALERRADVFEEYLEQIQVEEDTTNVRNIVFSVRNTLKNLRGQLEGLQDPYLIARLIDGERNFHEDLMSVDSLRERYGDVLQRIEEQQRSRRAMARRNSAFHFFGHEELDSRILTRGLFAFYYDMLRRQGVPAVDLEDIRESALGVEDWPAEIEREVIAIRLREMRDAFGASDPTIRRVLADRSAEEVADDLVEESALLDSTRFAEIFESGYLDSGDASVPVMQALGPLFIRHIQQQQSITDREENLKAGLARARFALYEGEIPPDANYSIRVADGYVAGYEQADTTIAPYTTFEGMYVLHEEHGPGTEWNLPERWLDHPDEFSLSTPLNMVSTNDITGGNSGSAMLNRDLEVVGLIFDSNYEALPNEYIYMNDDERAIAVDVRGILEALEHIYDADELLEELRSGRLVAEVE